MKLSAPLLKQAAERIFDPALRNLEYFQKRLSALAIGAVIVLGLVFRYFTQRHSMDTMWTTTHEPSAARRA